MVEICKFCNSKFTMKSNLITHQKQAKFCLEKRGIRPELVFCYYCNLGFVAKRQLERHLLKCTIIIENKKNEAELIYEEKINKLKTEIFFLEEKILFIEHTHQKQIALLEKIIASEINKTISNKINVVKNINIQPLTQECFDKISIEIKIHHLNDIISLIDFIFEFLKDKVICSDTARSTYRYKDESGKQIIDKKGKILFKKIFYCIKNPSKIIFTQLRKSIPKNEKLPELIKKISYLERGIEDMNETFLSEFRNKLSRKF